MPDCAERRFDSTLLSRRQGKTTKSNQRCKSSDYKDTVEKVQTPHRQAPSLGIELVTSSGKTVLATAPLCCACEGTSGSLIEDTFFSPLTRFVKSNSHEGICVEKGQSIKKDHDTKSSGWNQQLSIPAQPQIVQCHLLSKIWPAVRRSTDKHFVIKKTKKKLSLYCVLFLNSILKLLS